MRMSSVEGIFHQQMYNVQSVKGNSSGIKENDKRWNSDLQKENGTCG
jgi:hypothetical protein